MRSARDYPITEKLSAKALFCNRKYLGTKWNAEIDDMRIEKHGEEIRITMCCVTAWNAPEAWMAHLLKYFTFSKFVFHATEEFYNFDYILNVLTGVENEYVLSEEEKQVEDDEVWLKLNEEGTEKLDKEMMKWLED